MDIIERLDKLSNDVMLTPVEKVYEKGIGDVYVKRDDLYEYAGSRGGKCRSARYLCEKAKKEGYKVVVTAGARYSPQIEIVSNICKKLGMKCIAWAPKGEETNELKNAKRSGAEIIKSDVGYNNVIESRAHTFAERNKYFYVPFGMECWEAVLQTALQVKSIKDLGIQRIVMVAGSGMSASGVVTGLDYFGLSNIKMKLIRVGANPSIQLDKYAPGWSWIADIVKSEHDYNDRIEERLGGILLDPIYEAKCRDYIEEGDLFWIVGCRHTV